MTTVMLMVSCLLLAVGGAFLARRDRLVGMGIVLLSAIPLFVAQTFAKALFSWLALLGLMIMAVVFIRGLAGQGRA